MRETPVQIVEYPCKPWFQLAIDLKGPLFDSQHRPFYIIVLIDYYTKFIRAKVVNRTTTNDVITFLTDTFTIFGFCSILVSDNGPQFTSHYFEMFLMNNGIAHKRSSVYNPQSNGCVERVNRNINKLFDNVEQVTGIELAQEMLNTYVINYNGTTHGTTGKMPSELMFTYPFRTRLTMRHESDHVESPPMRSDNEEEKRIRRIQQERAQYANERRKPLLRNPFNVGDRVITPSGAHRTLVAKMGLYTFRMNDGFTINCRKLKKSLKAPFQGPELVFGMDDDRGRTEKIRMSGRSRRPPSYLKDYTC